MAIGVGDMRSLTVLALPFVLLGLGSPVSGQSNEAVGPPTVHPDGSVTFRRAAPDAERVVLSMEGMAPREMTQNPEGLWVTTTEPLPPDIYAYFFFIDGAPADDPANPDIKPVVTGGSQGLVEIPGDEPLPWERREAPSGTVEALEYASALLGESRRALVYLPPGYDSDRSTRYPVLYLLHGVMDDEEAWTTAGRADVILDNLLDAGLIEPMVVVMPLGYGLPNASERAGELLGPMDHRPSMDTFASSLISEVRALVEERYRVRGDQGSRAIAGLSMGGAQALYIGLTRPEIFGWVASMSGAFMMYGGDYDEWLAGSEDGSGRPQLWLRTGTQDFVTGANRQVVSWLESAEIAFEYEEVPGGHTWSVWRRALVDLLPLLFRTD